MSRENVELVRSIFAAWERGEYGAVEWAHPEMEYVMADGPSPGAWTGLAEMADAVREWLAVWQDYRIEADEYVELDGGRVLVLTQWSGRGRTSGVDLGQIQPRGAHLFHVRDGQVTRAVVYFERERALADLGLSSEAERE